MRVCLSWFCAVVLAAGIGVAAEGDGEFKDPGEKKPAVSPTSPSTLVNRKAEPAAPATGAEFTDPSLFGDKAPTAPPSSAPAAAAAAPGDGEKKAEDPKPAAPSVDFVAPTKREDPNAPEMDEIEYLYVKPPQVPGWAGWEKNKVTKKQLISDESLPVPDRWRVGFPADSRRVVGNMWNPYRQNMLKGDYPIIGQTIFMSLLAISDTLVEGHSVPTPGGVSTARPGTFEFFARPDQFVFNQNFIVSVELFKGESDFKPREWEIRATPVFNVNYVDVEENFAVRIDPRRKHERFDHQIAFQELFGEYHFRDISPNYDFVSSRTGIQFFNEDFRGFLFCDNNLGFRAFSILESNRLQANLAYFEMFNKDTNSGLNTLFEFKDEHVVLGNVIRQDTIWKGYNMIFNVGFSDEESSEEYNQNGVIVRPAPIGSLRAHSVKAGYVGFGGDGHIGRLNITHQFYQAFGRDSENSLAGKRQDINARMFALELSIDVDWMRFRSSFFHASGDDDVYDGTAGGFDAIFDNPNFAGGQFSYWVRQGFGAGNAPTSLKSRSSLLPNLATSSGEGQANFVNPGVNLFNIGYDAELTQNLKAVLNFNYLRFDTTAPLQTLLGQNNFHRNLGLDYSLGVIYRPFLNQQVIITGGVAGFTPLSGFSEIYGSETLYSGFLNVVLKY